MTTDATMDVQQTCDIGAAERTFEFELSDRQIEAFDQDGFVVVERLIDPALATEALARYEDLFGGTFETGLYPDEWNWRAGASPPELTRQICNAWKSDRSIAQVVLRADIGRACARLGGWPGARLSQDNVLWKPPGGKALGFHQDSSYEQWAVPCEWVSCWIALEDTTAAQGTVEYVRGSHRWSRKWGMIEQFHGPDDPQAELRQAAAANGVEPEIVPVEVPAGGGAFHHGWTWHGSNVNRSARPRRSLVAHCMSSEARFHPDTVGYLYSRYKRFGDDTMDESFFPVTWRADGYRSAFLDPYLERRVGWAGSGVGSVGA
jgi:ectoine hydroxylase-related dioxygenase (phytanoyl-CoA dioxygenase family)